VGSGRDLWRGLDPEQVQRAKMICGKGTARSHAISTPSRSKPSSSASRHRRDRASRSAVGRACRPPTTAAGTEVHHQDGHQQSGRIDLGCRHPKCTSSNRLAQQLAPGRTVVSLDQFGCLCSTMFRRVAQSPALDS
jgi:hypothetical protein